MDTKCGPMVQSMRVNGKQTRPTDSESWSMQMVTSMKANGGMTKLTVTDLTLTLTVQPMLVTGSTISNMAVVLRPGLMVPSMTASTSKERSMEEELLPLLTEVSTLEISR